MQDKENWIGFSDDQMAHAPMTLHIVLPTAEPDSLVWITDTRVSLGFDGIGSIEKIAYVENRRVACSTWGAKALLLRDALVRQIASSSVDMSNPRDMEEFLQRFAVMMIQMLGIGPATATQEIPGFIVTTFLDERPRIYFGKVTMPPVASEMQSLACIGDESSPGKVFVDHYYDISVKSVEQVVFLGIHAMRLAHQNNAAFFGEPNAWVYRDGVFSRLPEVDLKRYIDMSKALDSSITSSYAALSR